MQLNLPCVYDQLCADDHACLVTLLAAELKIMLVRSCCLLLS